jgi:hypothetical protein
MALSLVLVYSMKREQFVLNTTGLKIFLKIILCLVLKLPCLINVPKKIKFIEPFINQRSISHKDPPRIGA